MRKHIISASLLLLLAACQMQEEYVPVEPESGFTGETEEFAGETRTSLNESNSVVWSENDRIAVFQGSTVADLFEVSAASVGKTTGSFKEVTSEGGGGFESGNEIAVNVAVYPYAEDLVCSNSSVTEEDEVTSYKIENVELPSVQNWKENSFADESFVMVAVTSGVKDNKLRFRNVSGALRLRISGDVTIKSIEVKGNSDELISGSAEIYASADAAEAPSVVMQSNASRKVTLDCGDGVKLSSTSAKDFIIALPPTTFSEGFTVTITDENGKKDVRTSRHKNVINRSAILGMPEIVFGEGDLSFDKCTVLGVDETANSYIVSESGSYSFPAVKGNGTNTVGAVASVEVLWETFGTDEAIHKGDLISSVAYEGGNILFRTVSRFREGNAVIAARNSSGTILWSWHIWLTDQPQEHVYKNGAGTMMDRNLGAISATPGEDGTAGLMYQYGRKDPFLSGSTVSGDIARSSTTWPDCVETPGTIEYAVANPMTYLASSPGNGYKWYLATDDESKALWQSEKTIYDPCPAGWRIPDGGSEGIWKGGDFNTAFDDASKGISVIIDKSVETWYPACGFITSGGNLAHFSERGCYWATGKGMNFNNEGGNISVGAGGHCDGYSVRCYKEDSAESRIDYVDEYGVNHGKGTEIDGVVWAPVNCGYHATNFKYGKLYQWGRKYGQGYSGYLYDDNETITGTYKDSSVPTIKTGPVSLSTGQSKSNEKYFYKCIDGDWLKYPDDKLWNSGTEDNPVKTQYDPCPTGWRVPTYTELNNLYKSKNSSSAEKYNGQIGYWFSGASSYTDKVFLPAAGYLFWLDGDAMGRGKLCIYWSSSAGDSYYANAQSVGMARTYGNAVRCVQE